MSDTERGMKENLMNAHIPVLGNEAIPIMIKPTLIGLTICMIS